jgi:hypothetical protein
LFLSLPGRFAAAAWSFGLLAAPAKVQILFCLVCAYIQTKEGILPLTIFIGIRALERNLSHPVAVEIPSLS